MELHIRLAVFLFALGNIIGTGGLDAQEVIGVKTVALGQNIKIEISANGIRININKNKISLLNGTLGHDMGIKEMRVCQDGDSNSDNSLCFQWENGPKLELYESKMNNLKNASNFQCTTVNWTLAGASNLQDTPEDCFGMEEYFWFAGFEERNQTWPVNEFQLGSTPFITGEGDRNQELGDVIEGIFLSSSGTGIVVEETSPLYLSINSGGSKLLCLKGKVGTKTPFFHLDQAFLIYDICQSSDIVSLWKSVSDKFLPKPQSYPSTDVLRYPIWCTWATFKVNINQSRVLDYARVIKSYNFSISQLEIDDDWTPHYGDFTFNTATFPNAQDLIANLSQMGIPVTVWVHWFFNNNSDAFRELDAAGFLIKEYDSERPILVHWWNGNFAGVLDFTNPDAVKWYLGKLSNLRVNYNVSSFKFDAGEVKWVKDKRYKVKGQLLNPNYLTTKYAEATFQADIVERRQELRVGFRSQASSLMVRMFDRASSWSRDRGIRSLIPCALVFGFMGYPYILPDMIGGNAASVDPELFIRWLQATTFLPVLQFSLTPWAYRNSTITAITHKFVKLHETYADKIIDLARNAQKTGEPIVRPLWWIAPTDKDALAADSEFLLGNDLLVAPVLDKGARSRDIYLPAGQWRDELRNITQQGGTWLRNYQANLDELPYFTKL